MRKIILFFLIISLNHIFASVTVVAGDKKIRLANLKINTVINGVNNIHYRCINPNNLYSGVTGEHGDGIFIVKTECAGLEFSLNNNVILNANFQTANLDDNDNIFITQLAGTTQNDTANTKARQIARVLLTLDDDLNPKNNIDINSTSIDSTSYSFSNSLNETELQNIVTDQYPTRTLVDELCAVVHMERVLRSHGVSIDTVPPCKPELAYELNATSNNLTYVELLGEENTNIYLNGVDTGYDMDENGLFEEFELNTRIQLNSYDEFNLTLVDSKGPSHPQGVSEVNSIKIFNDPDQPILNNFSTTEVLSGAGTIDLNVSDTSKDHNLSDFPALTLKYEIFDNNVSGHSNYFDFNQSTGQIYATNNPSAGTYHIKIKISDQVLHYIESNLSITYTP
jgi:hypothetical protein